MTHGECLSGESAVLDNSGEELRLVHIGENESETAVLLGEGLDCIGAVDIVYLSAVCLDVAVKEVLE